MNRVVWFWVAVVAGIFLLALGYCVPIHIRAIDASVLSEAGLGTKSLGASAADLLSGRNIGAAGILHSVLQAEKLPGRDAISEGLARFEKQSRLQAWGAPPPRWADLAGGSHAAETNSFTDFVVRKEHRDQILDLLSKSKSPGVLELLRCRELTNTVIFPPSWTSSGQAFDAAISVCGLLMLESQLSPAFSNSVVSLANAAYLGANAHPLEQALLDLMSFGQRLNWGQLTAFVRDVQQPETLRLLAAMTRKTEGDLPALYAAAYLSKNPEGLTRYLMTFSKSGFQDVREAMRLNAGGLRLLLDRNQRLHRSPLDTWVSSHKPFHHLSRLAWQKPAAALALKWFLYLAAGYFFALAAHCFLRGRASRRFELFPPRDDRYGISEEARRPLDLPPVRGFHVARELLFALGFLLFVLLLSEPFLAQDSQKVDFPFRLRLPMVAGAAAAAPGIKATTSSFMNQLSLLTLLLFFVLQALIYTACMFKLAEIRRQKVGPRMKIKLLDNEDHLFDAGLYLGFVGTIISLILVSLGVIKPSLMAAYSSTSFGIIFVSFFKIFNLRPLKRRLILEAEAVSPEAAMPEPARSQPIS